MLIRQTKTVTVNVIYFRPDYQSLLQEFVWSVDDHVPELVRIHKFLWHWKNNIDAVVKEVLIGVEGSQPHRISTVDEIFKIN